MSIPEAPYGRVKNKEMFYSSIIGPMGPEVVKKFLLENTIDTSSEYDSIRNKGSP